MSDRTEWIEKLNLFCKGKFTISDDGNTAHVSSADIAEVLRVMKDNAGFKMLADITSSEHEESLEVIYHLMSLKTFDLVRFNVSLSKDDPVAPSVTSVWKAADVLEREIYDLMGIRFEGLENLKRILCPDNFEGFPLRKNFKLDVPDRFIE